MPKFYFAFCSFYLYSILYLKNFDIWWYEDLSLVCKEFTNNLHFLLRNTSKHSMKEPSIDTMRFRFHLTERKKGELQIFFFSSTIFNDQPFPPWKPLKIKELIGKYVSSVFDNQNQMLKNIHQSRLIEKKNTFLSILMAPIR